jgi:hypothetical protein
MGTPDRSLLGYRQVKPWKKRDDIENEFYTKAGIGAMAATRFTKARLRRFGMDGVEDLVEAPTLFGNIEKSNLTTACFQ